jgi:hypothetical protein
MRDDFFGIFIMIFSLNIMISKTMSGYRKNWLPFLSRWSLRHESQHKAIFENCLAHQKSQIWARKKIPIIRTRLVSTLIPRSLSVCSGCSDSKRMSQISRARLLLLSYFEQHSSESRFAWNFVLSNSNHMVGPCSSLNIPKTRSAIQRRLTHEIKTKIQFSAGPLR